MPLLTRKREPEQSLSDLFAKALKSKWSYDIVLSYDAFMLVVE